MARAALPSAGLVLAQASSLPPEQNALLPEAQAPCVTRLLCSPSVRRQLWARDEDPAGAVRGAGERAVQGVPREALPGLPET